MDILSTKTYGTLYGKSTKQKGYVINYTKKQDFNFYDENGFYGKMDVKKFNFVHDKEVKANVAPVPKISLKELMDCKKIRVNVLHNRRTKLDKPVKIAELTQARGILLAQEEIVDHFGGSCAVSLFLGNGKSYYLTSTCFHRDQYNKKWAIGYALLQLTDEEVKEIKNYIVENS